MEENAKASFKKHMFSDMRVTRSILQIRTQTKLVNLKEKGI